MSILIKGMNMPESCANCDIIGLNDVIGCKHTYDLENEWSGRSLDCPLVEFQDHGETAYALERSEKWPYVLKRREDGRT